MRVLPPLSDRQLSDYLERIGFSGNTPTSDLATLQALQYLHPQHIPFENLNSFTGRAVSIAPEAVYHKLVWQGRGGYCFEHNQLFARVLQTIGFEVQGLSARVLWMLPDDVVMPRTHMALLVNIEGRPWLADVGFGGLTITAALALDTGVAQATPHEDFRIRTEGGLFTVEAHVAGEWRDLYGFSMDPQLPVDYETPNWYVSTYPESRFVTQLICCRVEPEGRHVLHDRRYSWHETGLRSEHVELASPDAVLAILSDKLQIDISGLEGLPARIAQLFDPVA